MKSKILILYAFLILSVFSCKKECEKEDPCEKCKSYSEDCINGACVCKEGYKLFEGDCVETGREGEKWVKMMVQKGEGCYNLKKTYFSINWLDFKGLDTFEGYAIVPSVNIMLKTTNDNDQLLIWEQNGQMSLNPDGSYHLSMEVSHTKELYGDFKRPSVLKYDDSFYWLVFDGTFNHEITEFNSWIKLYECQDGDCDGYYPKREVLVDSCYMSWELFK